MREGRAVRKFLAVVWALIPPLLLSAVVHMIDPDVGGIGGLASPYKLLSVVVYGSPVAVLALLCLGLAIKFRWIAWVSVSGVVAAGIALVLAVWQRPQMPSPAELVRPFVGGTVLVWFLLALAVLPAWALGWAPTKGRSKPAA